MGNNVREDNVLKKTFQTLDSKGENYSEGLVFFPFFLFFWGGEDGIIV